MLLNHISRSGVSRIERLASRESFILTVIKPYAVFTEFPAKINFFVVYDRGKIQQANFKILDQTAGLEDAVQRRLHVFRQLRMLAPQLCQFLVGHQDAAHHHNARRYGVQVVIKPRELLAAIHCFDEEGLQLLPRTLRLRQREKPRLGFRPILLRQIIVFVSHTIPSWFGARRAGETARTWPGTMLTQREHAVEGNPCMVPRALFDRNAVHNFSGRQIFERPQQVFRRNTEHRRANANASVEGDYPAVFQFLTEPVHEVDFGSHCPLRTWLRSSHGFNNSLCRSDLVGGLRHLKLAFRVHDHTNSRILAPYSLHLLHGKPLVNGTVSLPQNYARVSNEIGRASCRERG